MSTFNDLIAIVGRLRGKGGCPWDIKQTLESMRPYIIEEAHEVTDCITKGDLNELKGELGDLLFQVVLLSQIASDNGDFNIDDVCRAASEKMVRRHPHVFVEGHVEEDAGSIEAWEARKALERPKSSSMMDGVPKSLPALLAAHRVGEKASRYGFDWPDIGGVHEKLEEELGELDYAIKNESQERVAEEYGDVLLATANMGRFLKVDPEFALKSANQRFESRFRVLEGLAQEENLLLSEMDVPALNALWARAKKIISERS
jgi:MazG family protein